MDRKKVAAAGLGRLRGLAGVAMLLLLGCVGPAAVAIFIPSIAVDKWIERGNPDHRFFFLPQNDGAESSNFGGNEFIGREGAPSEVHNSLSGAYAGRSIHFTIPRATGAVLFQGELQDANTMSLSSPAGRLVLVRSTG